MNLKTKAWPNGRDWPAEIVLDVGSAMPEDVYGVRLSDPGVLYVRHDIVTAALINLCEGHTKACECKGCLILQSLNKKQS